MKVKTKFISKKQMENWIEVSNLFAKSLVSPGDVIKQFNSLEPITRIAIKKEFGNYDNIRRKKIPKGEEDLAWEISVMVDAHILATEYNISPLTAIMCISPPCKVNEKVYVRP